MKTQQDIETVLKDCEDAVHECEMRDSLDSLIYHGWVEALKWVLERREIE